MALNRVLRAGKRSNCHLTLLNAIAGPQNRCAYGASRFVRNDASPRLHQIRFSSQFHQPEGLTAEESEEKQLNELENELENEPESDDFEALTSVLDDAGSTDESLPWYLQDQASTPVKRPLSERQQLPELPENAPPILDPLMKQISVDLGLDELILLDLRALDPPPALGANLIMLLGTARSERHLHVSADRLCRWLRSEYKLRPDADGLLGRAELKLKLRRKARRAKLTGNGVIDENADDGVRTGWVCVNVGTVEGLATAVDEKPQGFVGFGRRTEGIKIVVQMLTEEKRDELDLEHLWGGILRRSKPEGETDEAHPDVAVHGEDTKPYNTASST